MEVPVKERENVEISLTSPHQRMKEPDVLMQEEEIEFLKNAELQVLYLQLQFGWLLLTT